MRLSLLVLMASSLLGQSGGAICPASMAECSIRPTSVEEMMERMARKREEQFKDQLKKKEIAEWKRQFERKYDDLLKELMVYHTHASKGETIDLKRRAKLLKTFDKYLDKAVDK